MYTVQQSIFLLLLLFSNPFCVQSSHEEINRSQFPHGFLFGTATSSFQIEGATLEDGKGLSNWDVFTHIPGKILTGDNADTTDDHYHRYLEDIEMMHSLGVNAYRFSISWSRILPRGRFGDVNHAGVKFYNNLIDNLLLKGIEPFVTINHADIPQELEDRYGAWLSPQIQKDFVNFAETCFRHFGDRVKYWTTLNEPNLSIELAYIRGLFPPSHCSEPFGNCTVGNSAMEPLVAMHNQVLSHAKAAKIYKKHYQKKHGGCIGIVASTYMYEPLRDEERDKEAVGRALAFNVAWMLDPLIYGDYPPEMRHYLGSKLPKFSKKESKELMNSLDFIGINHYSSLYTKDCMSSLCDPQGYQAIRGFVHITGERDGIAIGEPTGMPTVYIVPNGLEKIIGYLKTRYGNKPIFVTENGLPQMHQPGEKLGELLNDVKRIEFHKAYLASLSRAISCSVMASGDYCNGNTRAARYARPQHCCSASEWRKHGLLECASGAAIMHERDHSLLPQWRNLSGRRLLPSHKCHHSPMLACHAHSPWLHSSRG